MKPSLISLLLVASLGAAHAQNKEEKAEPAEKRAHERVLKAESSVSRTDKVSIKGKVVPYKVTAGTQPVWDKDGKAIASLFYTYYQRTDVADKSRRPLVMSFNGGPGSASVWRRPTRPSSAPRSRSWASDRRFSSAFDVVALSRAA